ncbi:MAG: hypothetical protein J3K34DRAFT_406123 [Monoraphidium minutum]|nr:MAG: hypothetical protein J3K34DRAFT_406123 [Monoraphidium minutum]
MDRNGGARAAAARGRRSMGQAAAAAAAGRAGEPRRGGSDTWGPPTQRQGALQRQGRRCKARDQGEAGRMARRAGRDPSRRGRARPPGSGAAIWEGAAARRRTGRGAGRGVIEQGRPYKQHGGTSRGFARGLAVQYRTLPHAVAKTAGEAARARGAPCMWGPPGAAGGGCRMAAAVAVVKLGVGAV